MTNNIPGWNFESDICVTNQKRSIGLDQELVELLWQNGQVVFNSQTQRKQVGNSSDMRHVQKNEGSTLRTSVPYGNSSNLSQEDETISWLQYPLEDPLEQQFSSNFLPEIAPYQVESYKPIKQLEEGNFAKIVGPSAPHATSNSQSPNMKPSCVQEFQANPVPVPVPRFHVPDSSKQTNDFSRAKKVPKFSGFSAPPNVSPVSANAVIGKKVSTNMSKNEGKECSVMTVGSSHCGSNHIPQEPDVSMVSSSGWATTLSAETEAARDYVKRTIPRSEKGKSDMVEPNLTSSSAGSGSSLGKTCSMSTGNLGQKRKRTDAEESEEQSEATELKSGIGSKASQHAGSSRRNRAAEVHNLSERRRRDRINEKMRALQQLIPNSNKTDKASMLEEAIEYLKSLQLQLQVMWMGAGMSPMMFPGIQHYMSQMSMGMGAPSIQNPMQLPRVPLDQPMTLPQTPNQNVMCQNPVLGAFNYQNQMQNSFLAEQYARYMGCHLMQSATQPMNAYRYGSQALQQGQTMITPTSGAPNMDDSMTAKMGSSTFK